jgi:Protein of unknown function (DUF3485)
MPPKSEPSSGTLFTTPFVISVLLLGVTALGLAPVTQRLQAALTKEAIALREPLSKLDKGGLGPYRFLAAHTLDDNIVASLGTDQYIDWILEDTTYAGKDRTNPLRFARLFVTYYTGQPDAVPHTPDVCMVGAGYTMDDANNITINVPGLADSPVVPVRALTFVKSGVFDADRMTVVYTFHTNGQFAETREGVRQAVNRPSDHHAYYSKVEVVFGSSDSRPPYPSREDAIKATEKLLGYALPMLVERHWPDWEAVKKQEAGERSDSDSV